MHSYFADLHIHIGMSQAGRWIKIPTSKHLTVENVLKESLYNKGLDIIGIVDSLSPSVQTDLTELVAEEVLVPLDGGGYRYQNSLTLLLGAEIETIEPGGGMIHTVLYLPTLAAMQELSKVFSRHIRNIHLSSQNAHMSFQELVEIGTQFGAIIMPAHIFTPYKSLYGATCQRLGEILPQHLQKHITAMEIGLSADSLLADRLAELHRFTLLSNSDAHSLEKIAREYNQLLLKSPNYEECLKALKVQDGRCVQANYGLDPRLGKYHGTLCNRCGAAELGRAEHCPYCGSAKLTRGVFDRIDMLADSPQLMSPANRPPYFYQVPLEFMPGIGKKTLRKLLNSFQTEMNILHNVPGEAIAAIAGETIADQILAARRGEIRLTAGGGGVYGKILK